MRDSRAIRTLIVGMGGISRQMHGVLKTKPWYECCGVVDVTDAGLAAGHEAAGLPDAALFKDLDRALSVLRPDAVLINTPSELHFAQARQCIEANCHLLVAKPVTNDFAQAVALVELAEAKGLKHCVAQQIRYNRHYTALADFVNSGALGSVEAAWFMNSKPRPNVANLGRMLQPALYEMACHHFDAFLSVFAGREPEWISCDGFMPSWSQYAGPCMVNALLRFSGNLHLAYHSGFSSQAPMYEFRLEGSRGALKCRGLHMSNDTMDYEVAPALGLFAAQRIDAAVPVRDPWIPFLDAWHAYLCGGAEPPFSGRNNLKTFAMLSAAIESVETGGPVRISENPSYAAAFAVKGSAR
jgi:scyllo-inositol 2-dehydrogenase (NADP+)